MTILIDTHVLYWILTGKFSKFSSNILTIISEADRVLLPTIMLLELMRLLEKKHQVKNFKKLLDQISSSRFSIINLDLAVIKETLIVNDSLELHDRVIVATAKHHQCPLITKDQMIQKIYPKAIW